ncbi:MFS general substrate transporter [Alternaria alternata]|nr:MFS general substrate transporter [Alternaria alternata]KAH6852090.1 major facilitator superfamily domain-containing protein [Alternaria alternata]OAG26288.1 MFS general substrate transporter [Alternaria alternata]
MSETYSNRLSSALKDPHPMVELAPPPNAHPVSAPHPIYPPFPDETPGKRPSVPSVLGHHSRPMTAETARRSRRESYNLIGSTFLITNDGRTLKLPMPSNSKADPLNWNRWKTGGALFSVALFSVVCLTAAQAASVVLDDIQRDFAHEDIPAWLLKALVTAPTLFMGLGCFLWVPVSIGLGRRPTMLIATLVVLLAMLWAGEAGSFRSLVGAVCFLGLGEGLALSLAFLMVIDLTYINQRSAAVALMWCMAGCFGTSGVALVPVLADHGNNWRNFYHYWTIPVVVSLAVTFALYPETYFKRPTVAFNGLILLQSATEKLTVYEDREKDSEIYRDLPEYPLRTGFAGFRDKAGLSRSPFASWASAGRCIIQMAYCAANPLIFWVFVASAFNSASMIFIGATYARILIAPPYNMSPSVVGTVNVASGFGALCGLPIFALLFCKVLKRLSSRNRGVLEAEHYLVGYILPVITGALSSVLYGLAVHFHWQPVAIYFAYGINGFSFITLMIANTLWVTEAFPRWAAPAIAVVGGGCYILSFAMSFALVPWIDAHGYMWVGIELMIFQVLGGLVAMPVAFWGKSTRQAIAGRWSEDRSGALRPL